MNQESVILLAQQRQQPDGALTCCQTFGTRRGPSFEPASVPRVENSVRGANNEVSTATASWRVRWALVHSRLWCGCTVVVFCALLAYRQEYFDHDPSRPPTVRLRIAQ
jgi:hypothetical protein